MKKIPKNVEKKLRIKKARCQKNWEKRGKISCVWGSGKGAKWRRVVVPRPAFFDSISAFGRWALPPTPCPKTQLLAGLKQNQMKQKGRPNSKGQVVVKNALIQLPIRSWLASASYKVAVGHKRGSVHPLPPQSANLHQKVNTSACKEEKHRGEQE